MQLGIGNAIVLILLLGIAAQWLSWRLRIPAIVLLSVAGIIAGPVVGVLHPHAIFGRALEPVIGLCVAVILFDGGLNLQFHELRHAARGVRRLVYVGVPVGWLLGSFAAHQVGGLTWPVALVFGAIIVVTGPTVILPLLRHAMLNRRTASYLKWEGILNDPIGVLLAVLVFQYFAFYGEDATFGRVLFDLGRAVVVSTLLGGGMAWIAGRTFQRNLVPEYLKLPITLGLVLGVYTVANLAQDEAGLFAVTVLGIGMSNIGLASIQEMRRFKEYITILLVSAVFILLTADLDPSILAGVEWRGVVLLAVVMFVVRPVTVLLATIGAGMDWRDRTLLAWIAPRGIVAAATAGVLAPRMLHAGYQDASILLALVFALILATVLLHGLTLGRLARWLGLASATRNRFLIVGASPWSTELARTLAGLDVPVLLVDTSWHRLRPARLAGIPVYYGEILSDTAEKSLELNDVGTLLAATSNDAYNALVCTAFAADVGRTHVLQLPMYAADDDDPKGVARVMRGRIAFNERALYEDLWHWLTKGWKFQKTRLTEEYDMENYELETSTDSITLMLLRPDGTILVHSPEQPLNPKAGDVVLSFGPPRSTNTTAATSPIESAGTQAEKS